MRLSLVPQERRFYDLFRRQGELIAETLDELSKSLLEGRSRQPRLRDLEHQCDEVTHQIYRLTDTTFVTPLPQEDLLALAASCDDVVDIAEEVSDKIELYRVGTVTDQAKRIGELAASAGMELSRALAEFENRDVAKSRLEVHRLENEADQVGREALSALFAGDGQNAIDVIKWKEIYDLLEAILDKCEHVANVLEGISIKNA